MEPTDSGIFKFFDGTWIDVARILEISPLRQDRHLNVSFDIHYMFRDTPKTFEYTPDALLGPGVYQVILAMRLRDARHPEEVASSARNEIANRLLATAEGHHSNLVETWKSYRRRTMGLPLTGINETN